MDMRQGFLPALVPLVLLLAAVAISCGGTPATAEDDGNIASAAGATKQHDAPESDRVYFTPVAADQSQADSVADGNVTRDEYDAAVARTMTCLDEKGIEHSDPVYNEGRGQYGYTVVNPAPLGLGGRSPADECWMKHERDVQTAWVDQQHAQ